MSSSSWFLAKSRECELGEGPAVEAGETPRVLHVVVGLTVKAHVVVVVLLQQKDANKRRTAWEIVMVDMML